MTHSAPRTPHAPATATPPALSAAAIITAAISIAASADTHAGTERILFIHGADRSGGFLEPGSDTQRTEQLADITNTLTTGGNHGWFQLAERLRTEGYLLEQIAEPLEPSAPPTGQTAGAPLDLTDETLAGLGLYGFDAIVMGSNNAAYPAEQAEALDTYIRCGGAVLFISDANFGGSWADAPTSDQSFLTRFGWTMQQDQGTYTLRRADADFLDPAHPILTGVNAFDGEGVSPVVVPEADTVAGVSSTIVVRGKPGQQTRNNDRSPGPGTSRPVGPRDAVLAVATVDNGRIAAHFDRNTFFNTGGAGTNITRFDNTRYAINLFAWLTTGDGPVCCPADRAAPRGRLDIFDILGFVAQFAADDDRAELTGDGVLDLFDILEYFDLFGAGC